MTEDLRLLAISYAYLPDSFPRSIQVARLLAALPVKTTLLCAEDFEAQKDDTIAPLNITADVNVIRQPFRIRFFLKILRRLHQHLGISFFLKQPDPCIFWLPKAWKAAKELVLNEQPDVITTFGMPMSDHILGLLLKKHFKLPWIAHFSDPWTDNPYIQFNTATGWTNRKLESMVMNNADAILFTNQETVSLVMEKYPDHIRKKAMVLPHAYAPDRYSSQSNDDMDIIRHIGAFYGLRTPIPFLNAVQSLQKKKPELFDTIRFEFVGPIENRLQDKTQKDWSSSELVSFLPPVDYQESLNLMASAKALLLIDAPMETSPFFPSKLADYIGSGKPIFSITPNGPAKRIIQEYNLGLTVDTRDDTQIEKALEQFLTEVKEGISYSPPDDFQAETVAREFKSIIQSVLKPNINEAR